MCQPVQLMNLRVYITYNVISVNYNFIYSTEWVVVECLPASPGLPLACIWPWFPRRLSTDARLGPWKHGPLTK